MLSQVEASTGRPVIVRADPTLTGRARGAYLASRPASEPHLIIFAPEASQHLNHIVAHELGHLEQHIAIPARNRLLPVISSPERESARRDVLGELRPSVKAQLHSEELANVADLWTSGTVTQLTSFPADILIERALWNEHPALRKAQRAALERSAHEAHESLRPRVRFVTAPSVDLAANSMNFALLRNVSRFLGAPWMTRPYRGTAYERLGSELNELLDVESPSDLHGLNRVSEQWAKRLGVQSWFHWSPFASVTPRGARPD